MIALRRRLLRAANRFMNRPPLSGLLRSYRLLWEAAALTQATARDATLTFADEQTFEIRGQQDAERLKPFLHGDAVVLDLGCGIGRVMKYVAPHCAHVHGVDISWAMLRHARSNLKGRRNVSLHRNNGKDLREFADHTFDLVYSFLMLQHLEREDMYIYLEEIYRVLKPAGWAFLQFIDLRSETGTQWFVSYARHRSRHAARVRPIASCEVEWLLDLVGFIDLDLSREERFLYAAARRP